MSVLRGVYSLVPLVTIAVASGIGGGQSVFDPSFNPQSSSAKQGDSESPTNASAPRIDCKAKFIMSLCMDQQGFCWAGSEGDGVFRIDLSTGKSQQFTTKDGLGDDDVYAVACDRKGRIWVGHCNHGVSVWNGERWQVYEPVGGFSRPDTLSGPLGERVFAIKVCGKTGDVWICTNCGLSIYSESKDTWSYLTRADGLPSDQSNAIAFDRDGNIYVGTQCDGIAMADADKQYKNWRVVTGPDQVPLVSAGPGLPTSLINDLLVAKNGTIYAATDCGLALSQDNGHSWQFVRGADWAAKVRGLAGAATSVRKPTSSQTLAEDYCTSLAEAQDGGIWIGHRNGPVERLRRDGRLDLKQAYPPMV
jgi:ligand-binding sensor domain-containing protein